MLNIDPTQGKDLTGIARESTNEIRDEIKQLKALVFAYLKIKLTNEEFKKLEDEYLKQLR